MAGQGQGIAFQDQQMQFNNALQALGQAMNGQFGASQAYGNAGNGAVAQQTNLINLLNGIQGNIQDITQPVYSRPNINNPYGGIGSSLASLGQYIDGGLAHTTPGTTPSTPNGNYWRDHA
jgi:hypothetical protein